VRVAFRADASNQIGTGHIVRCLTLADHLAKVGAQCTFICRSIPEVLARQIQKHSHELVRLPPLPSCFASRPDDPAHASWLGVTWEQDAEATAGALISNAATDWLVIDHYALDRRWQEMMRSHTGRIAVVDDLSDRVHDCDLLLDQNDMTGSEVRYRDLVPTRCRLLLGPRYALLRPEFAEWRARAPRQRKSVRRLLVFFGGSDASNCTEAAIEALDRLSFPFEADIVVGGANLARNKIADVCQARANLHFHCQIDNMAEIMTHADLAIGASGTTVWERMCLGLPSIVVAIERNQLSIARDLARFGHIRYLGDGFRLKPAAIATAVEEMASNEALLNKMSVSGLMLVDGCGVERVVQEMI
jgi:UDP-2,4-diacetamido-2,4,6-trideoxy-beta-L-altropyranose hydrolase